MPDARRRWSLGLVLLFLVSAFPSDATAILVAIPPTSWSVRFVDSEERAQEDGRASNAFDGRADSLWHTEWSAGSPAPPHELQIDLGSTQLLAGFRYLPRQDGLSNGRIARYELAISVNGTYWQLAASGVLPDSGSETQVTFTAASARYVRLRALSEVEGRAWTSIAELSLLTDTGSANQPPNGTIIAPAADLVIAVGAAATFAGSGTDPDSDGTPQLYWDFGAAGAPGFTGANPPPVVFSEPGVYVVTLTAVDRLGAADPTPATRLVRVESSGASVRIPRGAWRVWWVDSQETAADNGLASNAFDGDPGTFWHTAWSSQSPPPPHELSIDLSGRYTIAGVGLLPRRDQWPNGRIRDYEVYVSIDGSRWGSPVAAGQLTDSPDEVQIAFAPREGRYVRLRALSEVNGQPWTSLAELDVYAATGSVNQPPSVTLSSPSPAFQTAPGAVGLSAVASDPDGVVARVDLLANGTTVGSDTQPPYAFQFGNLGAGTYGFAAVATDNSGNRASSNPIVLTVSDGSSSRPYRAVFTPSRDHDRAVSGYRLEIVSATGALAAAVDLGRPPVIGGVCEADISGTTAGLASGVYAARIAAVGPGGTSAAAVSPTFTIP